MTIPEAAKALGISKDLCGDMIRAGKIPHLRWGHRVLVPRKMLERYIEDQAAQSVSEAS